MKAAAKVLEEPWKRPALSNTGRKSSRNAEPAGAEAQAVAEGPSSKAGVSGSPHLKRPEQKSTKGVETPWQFPMLAELPCKSLPPPDSRHEAAAGHSPKATATASRKPAKCAPERAVPGVSLPCNTRRSSKQGPPLNQDAIPATTRPHAANKRKLTLPPPTPEEAKKDNRREPVVAAIPMGGAFPATGKASLILVSPEAAGGGGAKSLPRKSAILLPNQRKPTLVSPLAVLKGRRSRAVSFPAKPVYIKERTRSTRLLDYEEPGWQPYHFGAGWEPLRRQRPEAAESDDILADLRGMTKLAAGPRFDPFQRQSKCEAGSPAGAGTMTPTIASLRYKQKRMSSIPGFRYPLAPAPKRTLIFPEREQSLAMERVAGLCVLVVTAAAVLFLVYYMLRADDTRRPTSYATPVIVPDSYRQSLGRGGNHSIVQHPPTPGAYEWDPWELPEYGSLGGLPYKVQDAAMESAGSWNDPAEGVDNSGSYATLQNRD
ncbi:hypothetical protein V5799_026293 [Amblyomma americanum]|uniref:Uncharacterized protein n=1 Tax=Amblyomma americanum TaxID=6943 RepID=A0AAQ4DJ04_AMBAM